MAGRPSAHALRVHQAHCMLPVMRRERPPTSTRGAAADGELMSRPMCVACPPRRSCRPPQLSDVAHRKP
jgi:hypothetical protein